MAEVICVGIAYLDYVFEGDFDPSDSRTMFANDFNQYGGGMAATAGLKCTKPGGRGAIPCRAEIWKLLDAADAA